MQNGSKETMATYRIAPKDFTKYMNSLLEEYGDSVIDIAITAADDTSQEARTMLRSNNSGAFKNRTGSYRRGWRATLRKTRTAVLAQVYNATDYQLTHLLEYGHDVIRNGKKIGEAEAYPHIKDVNTWAIKSFEDALTEGIVKL